MTKPSNDSAQAAELRQLLAAASLGAATDADIQRLNDLLLSDVQLRHLAARFFEEDAVLRREFALLDRVVDFHNPPGNDVRDKSTPTSTTTSTCTAQTRRVPWRQSYLAVALVACAIAAAVWWQKHSATPGPDGVHGQLLATNPPVDSTSPRHVTPLAASGSILSPVTHVSWSGPRFASESSAAPPKSPMREGIIPFISAFGRPAEGFMVCLRPNTLMDLVVAADSDGENALAVIEFDGFGLPTGRRISFTNSAGEGPQESAIAGRASELTKKGRLGIWSERNDSDRPRYYFFTGVHKLLNRSADDAWHVSRVSPFVEEPGLVQVGWDDSGMPPGGDKDLPQIPDDDFDDVSATIRIRDSNPELNQRPAGVQVYSRTPASEFDSNLAAMGAHDSYPFTVGPGQIAIVKVCSRSGALVKIALAENETGSIRWQCEKEKSLSPTLGICAIENNTQDERTFTVVAVKKLAETASEQLAQPLPHKVLFEKESLVTVGFDQDKDVSDFNRVRVDILTLDEL